MTALLELFDPMPSWRVRPEVTVGPAPAENTPVAGVDAVGVPVSEDGPLPAVVTWSRAELTGAGFDGKVGQALAVPSSAGQPVIVYGTGPQDSLDATAVRSAAAGFARAASRHGRLAMLLPGVDGTKPGLDAVAQAAVEGVLLARYVYSTLRHETSSTTPLTDLTVLVPAARRDEVSRGVQRGVGYATATLMARDLANAPPSLLTAERFAEVAQELANDSGLAVEVFDKDDLVALGCGGLLGVNAGSVDPPRMIKLRYQPESADAPRLTLVGKGIMYDSGGIALKPADAVHATMKNDMSGAGAILAAMAVLRQVQCPIAVTAYLMCTDNMPSGSATKLGDVLSLRGGTTVEVINTDAEGRLVMADALVLATEEPTDAIIDIATLTGACMRALGTQIAGVFGNDQPLVDQVLAASEQVDESAWQLPLAHRYRKELDSDVADIKNMGGPNGGAIHAALFLEEFVAGKPWAHIDIAGTAQNDTAAGWQSRGCTGFGARLLLEVAMRFTKS